MHETLDAPSSGSPASLDDTTKDYSELPYPLTGLGACLAATGKRAEAIAALERALKVGKDG